MHIEDQVGAKRCGHRPGKELVTQEEMVDRIKAAVDARPDPSFVVMARTDALAVEGLQAAIERAARCVEAGVDVLGTAADGAGQTSDIVERRPVDHGVDTPVVQLGQRELQQRQRAGRADGLGDQGGDHAVLERHADAGGGLHDRLVELGR